MKRALVTGSSGLIGSEAVAFLDERGWRVHGVDNNMRRDFFGGHGDTTWNLERLQRDDARASSTTTSTSATARGCSRLVAEVRPDADRPLRRAAVARPRRARGPSTTSTSTPSARSTCSRRRGGTCPESPFVFLSTNKVYGDAPNELELVELETRWDYADPAYRDGIDETMRIDGTMHCLFGASKVAADVLVQEYGRYFGMPTVLLPRRLPHRPATTPAPSCTASSPTSRARCARAAPTGSSATRASRCATTSTRTTSARRSWPSPSDREPAAVYNLGGGRANSVSMLEAIARFEELLRPQARTRVRRRAEARRPHLLHQRPRAPPRRLPRLGAQRSRSTRSSTSSSGSRRRRRRPDAQ